MNTKWLSISLVLSLAVNLLLVGYTVGRSSGPVAGVGPDPTRGYLRWTRSLTEERRRELRPLIRAGFQNRPRHAMRELHDNFRAAVAADPYDMDAMDAALRDMRAHHHENLRVSHETFKNFVAALTAEERAALAQRLSHPPKRERRGH